MIRIYPEGLQHPHEQVDVLPAAVEILAFSILHDVQAGHRTGCALHGHVDAVVLQDMRDYIRYHRGQRDDEHHHVLPGRPVEVHPVGAHAVLHEPERVLYPILPQIGHQHRIRGRTGPYILRILIGSGKVRDQHPHPAVLGEGLGPLPVERQPDVDLVLGLRHRLRILARPSPVPVSHGHLHLVDVPDYIVSRIHMAVQRLVQRPPGIHTAVVCPGLEPPESRSSFLQALLPEVLYARRYVIGRPESHESESPAVYLGIRVVQLPPVPDRGRVHRTRADGFHDTRPDLPPEAVRTFRHESESLLQHQLHQRSGDDLAVRRQCGHLRIHLGGQELYRVPVHLTVRSCTVIRPFVAYRPVAVCYRQQRIHKPLVVPVLGMATPFWYGRADEVRLLRERCHSEVGLIDVEHVGNQPVLIAQHRIALEGQLPQILPEQPVQAPGESPCVLRSHPRPLQTACRWGT